MPEYCHKHNTDNCIICAIENQTEELSTKVSEFNKSNKVQYKRKSDLPSLIVQLIIIGLLIFLYVKID